MSELLKEQWGLFADSKANGTRDPNRHDAGSLMEFFATIAMQQFNRTKDYLSSAGGQPVQSGGGRGYGDSNYSGGQRVIELVKQGQRNSSEWKTKQFGELAKQFGSAASGFEDEQQYTFIYV